MERDQDGKPVVREVPSKLASAIRREVPLAYNDGGAQKDLGKVELYITSRFVNATGAEVRGHVEGTNAEIERSVSANQEQAATVEEIVRTAAELAKVAEGLTANVARYKV